MRGLLYSWAAVWPVCVGWTGLLLGELCSTVACSGLLSRGVCSTFQRGLLCPAVPVRRRHRLALMLTTALSHKQRVATRRRGTRHVQRVVKLSVAQLPQTCQRCASEWGTVTTQTSTGTGAVSGAIAIVTSTLATLWTLPIPKEHQDPRAENQPSIIRTVGAPSSTVHCSGDGARCRRRGGPLPVLRVPLGSIRMPEPETASDTSARRAGGKRRLSREG